MDQQSADELHKPIIRKFIKKKVQSNFIDNICRADRADMQLVSKFNKEFIFLLSFIDIYRKYVWVINLKDKKGTTITNAFQKNWKKSNHKANKIWVDKGSAFYNKSMMKEMKENLNQGNKGMMMNEGKSVFAERFIRNLKNKLYKYMALISKNVYIGKLDDIVNNYNNTYHSTIKIKPVHAKSKAFINSSKEINDKDPKFRISKYKNIFTKSYILNWSEEAFVIKKVKNTVP